MGMHKRNSKIEAINNRAVEGLVVEHYSRSKFYHIKFNGVRIETVGSLTAAEQSVREHNKRLKKMGL